MEGPALSQNESDRILLIAVDDSETALELVGELEGELIEVSPVVPSSSQDVTLATILAQAGEERPVVIVVDYRLDEPEEITYRGGSIAAGIKDASPDLPVAMITSDSVMHNLLEARPVARHSFDAIILKNRLIERESLDRVGAELGALAHGFRALKLSLVDFNSTSDLVRVIGRLLKSGDHELNGAEIWITSEIEEVSVQAMANWLLDSFLKTVGPLADKAEAAASLGLTDAGFDAVLESSELIAAAYSGVFSGIRPLWWRDDLWSLRAGAQTDSSTYDYSALGLAAEVGEIAGCTWCSDLVSRACSVCKLGCDESHSLPLAKQRGRWGLPLVACFRCIANGEIAGADIDPFSSELVDLLIRGTISSPSDEK